MVCKFKLRQVSSLIMCSVLHGDILNFCMLVSLRCHLPWTGCDCS